MNDLTSLSHGIVSFAATYFLHSTALLAVCWIAIKSLRPSSHFLVERMWKLAAVLGVLTAALQCGTRSNRVDVVWSRPTDSSWVEGRVERTIAFPKQAMPDSSASTNSLPRSLKAVPTELDQPKHTDHVDPAIEFGRPRQLEPSPSEPTTATFTEPIESAAATRRNHDPPIRWPGESHSLLPFPPTAVQTAWLRTLLPAMFTAVSCVLIVSVFAGAMLLACQSWRLRIRFSDAHVLQQGIARRALDRFLKSNTIRRRVRLLSSNGCVEPITYGLLSWTIVLPSGTDQRLGREELNALLAHEVAHLVRGDVRWLWIGRVLCTCFAFQPLNFVARRRWQLATEYLCDDWAVERGIRSLSLARCLTKIAEWRFGRRTCAAGLAAGGSRTTLVQRVERLVAERQDVDSWSKPLRRRLVNVAAALCIPLLVGFAPRVGVPLPTARPEHEQREIELGKDATAAGHQELKLEWKRLEEELLQLEAQLDRAKELTKHTSHQPDLEQLMNGIRRRAALLRVRREWITSLFGKESAR